MVTILVVGFIAWALAGAVEDNIRAARGDAPRASRPGFRGYLDDRFKALADHHHRTAASGRITALGYWERKRSLAREKTLTLAGYKNAEEIAQAGYAHRQRMEYIARGIDPDNTLASLSTVKQQEPLDPLPAVTTPPSAPAGPAEPGIEIDGRRYTSAEVWINPEYFPPEPSGRKADTAAPDPRAHAQPWSPYATSNSDKKEATPMEINSPADVKRFHDALKANMRGVATIVDTLNGLAYDLNARAGEVAVNITATETAAAGMTGLGMEDGAAAARALLDAQQAIKTAMDAIVTALQQHGATITDQAQAAQAHLDAIKRAHDAQLLVQEARRAAGRGNLAEDTFLDRD